MSTNVSLKFVLPSHPRFLPVVRAAVGELAAIFGLPGKECRAVTLAVDEAVANIIRHAYHGHSGRAIQIDCQAGDSRLEFTFLDQGDPPDPVRLRPHALDCVSLSGRGTHIIRSIMDEVCYERLPEGNQLRLSKHLPAARTGAKREREVI